MGRKPTGSLPWFFNVCRQRLREAGAEHSAFAPTGKAGFHDVPTSCQTLPEVELKCLRLKDLN